LGSRAFSGLKGVSNSIKANNKLVGVNNMVWHSKVVELGGVMSRAIAIVIGASL
jgi:hypothetical protein